LKRLKKEL